MYCKICGEKTRTILHEKLKASYHCCSFCEFISKDENSMITQEKELKIYNSHNNSIEDVGYVNFLVEFLKDAVFKFVDKVEIGLDFGSGPSPVLAMLLERDYCIPMDIYDYFYAPQKIYQNKKYDLITTTEVVEHLKDPLYYFNLFKEHLKDDGVLAVMTLFHPENDKKFLDSHYVRDKSHISFFTPKTLKLIAEKTGLEMIYDNGQRYSTFRKAKNK